MSGHSVLEPLEALGPSAGVAAVAVRAVNVRLGIRVLEALLPYLPLLFMGFLAAGTWWLVQNSQLPGDTHTTAAPRHEPDYGMQKFSVQRFTSDGSLRAQIDGDTLRHYPDTDTLEIDNPRIKAYAPEGRITLASAGRGVANGDATEVQLIGSARVIREADGEGADLLFEGEFLHAFFTTEQVRSHLPVTITRAGAKLRADALSYDNLDRTMLLKGKVRASFTTVNAKPSS